jgi:5-methyltetrahydropteroyltriglutamate--homocysteine methyltransferase
MRATRRPRDRSRASSFAAVEDRAIAEVVKAQENAGLQGITDGEFRRTYFHIDFLEQIGGVKTDIPVTGEATRRNRGARAAGDAAWSAR